MGGPRQGYRYLVSTNLDQGQVLEALASYLRERGNPRVKLGYYGSADARYYGIDYEYLPSVGLAPQSKEDEWWHKMDQEARDLKVPAEPGLYAVSANLLVGRIYPRAFAWLREREPVAQIGYTIFIYEVE